MALILVGVVPVAADVSTHSPEPAAGLADGSTPTLALNLGTGPAVGSWLSGAAAAALPPPKSSGPVSASAPLWILPPIPTVTVPSNVVAFDKSTVGTADKMAHDVVLDLIIESEARRAHDTHLAESGATGDALKEFVDVINGDIAGGKIIQKTYSYDKVSLNLYLPKFSSQASRLVGVTCANCSASSSSVARAAAVSFSTS